MKNILFLAVSTLVFIGCSSLSEEEIGRMSLSRVSNDSLEVKEVSLSLKKGDKLAFWVDMDIEYENEIGLFFNIELIKDGVSLGGLQLDALHTNPTFGSVKTEINGNTDWSYSGRLEHTPITEDGNYVVRTALMSSERAVLTIKKADLILKK